MGVRVPAPTHEEVVATLHSVAKKEYLKLPDALATRIAEKSGRNLRRAVLMLETAKVLREVDFVCLFVCLFLRCRA